MVKNPIIEQSKLFFIIGIGRSGTTILQEVMNTFKGFCNLYESRVGPDRISCYSYILKNNDFSYLEKYIKNNWTDEYFVEKTPNSILCLPQLFKRYPKANYLFLERHPLKILLSQMNLHPPGEKDRLHRQKWLKQGNIGKEDLYLNYEQYKAKQNLKWVKAQVASKELFPNQVTIKYEGFIKEIDSYLRLMEKKFNIIPNFIKAKQVLARQSSSSKKNVYKIQSLSDNQAIKMIMEACSLWNYNYQVQD